MWIQLWKYFILPLQKHYESTCVLFWFYIRGHVTWLWTQVEVWTSWNRRKQIWSGKFTFPFEFFTNTQKVDNVFPSICSFLLYLHHLMSVNIKLEIKGYIWELHLWLHALLDKLICNGRAIIMHVGIIVFQGVCEKRYWAQISMHLILFSVWTDISVSLGIKCNMLNLMLSLP